MRDRLHTWLRQHDWRWVLTTIAILAGSITIIQAAAAFFSVPRTALELLFGAGLLVIVAALSLALAATLYAQRSVSAVARAVDGLHDAIHQLRNAIAKHHKGATDASRSAYLQSLAEFESAMSVAASAKCRVAVKLLADDQARAVEDEPLSALYVTTYGRSEGSLADRPAGARKDWVTDNTDFELLMDPDRRVFCGRDLTTYPGYKNSHWDEDTWANETFDYRAAIVWPIRHIDLVSEDQQTADVVGFLAVDSKSPGAFSEAMHFGLGAAFADALYAFLKIGRDTAVAQIPGLGQSPGDDPTGG